MRQNRIGIVGCLAFLLVLFGTSGRAAAVLNCTDLPITGTKVADLVHAGGFIQGPGATKCALVIENGTFAGLSTDPTLVLTAQSITIRNATMIIDNPNSSIRFNATDGNILLDNAIVKAHKLLNFQCLSPSGPDCTFTAMNNSELVVATSFIPPLGCGGDLILRDIEGDVTFTNTFVHGGNKWEVFSTRGDITIDPCGADGTQCVADPTVSPFTPTAIAACDTNNDGIPDFPCTLELAEAKTFCVRGGEIAPCNGGCTQKRFHAENGGIFMNGTTITSKEHITFRCGPKGFHGVGSTIKSDDDVIIDCSFGDPGGSIDLTNAKIIGLNGPATGSTTLKVDPIGPLGAANTIDCTGGTFIPRPTVIPLSAGINCTP